jgi:DNA primase
MTISPETVDQIRLSIDIAELIREYVPALKKSGRNWKANCPFHHEKTPSFMVSAEKGIFHCFGCHAGGDVFKFVMLMDSLTWPEAVKKLAHRAGIVIKESHEDVVKRSEKQKIYDLLEQASNFYHRHLIESAEAKKALAYIRKRGVSDESIRNFRLGLAPAGLLLQSALKKGFTVEQLAIAGLITRTDSGRCYEYMSDRLVFPIFDSQGRVVAFGGRTLKDEQPKYLNTPETPVYSKSHQLYGLYQAIPSLRQSREVIILEGYMDVVVTHQFGISNTVATLGTALTSAQSTIIGRYAEKVILLFDSDRAGNAAAKRAIENLIESDLSLAVASLPEGVDPDEFLLQEGKEKFAKWLVSDTQTVIQFLTVMAVVVHGKDTPESKAKIAADILPLLERVKNAILRREWIKHLADCLQTTEETLLSEWRRMTKTPRKYGMARTAQPPTLAPAMLVRSAEEEVLQIFAHYPQCGKMIGEDVFTQERDKKVYALLAQGMGVTSIVDHLDEQDTRWFTELMLEEKNYQDTEQVMANLLRDVRQQRLEQQRQQLEKEVIQMMNGQIPSDDDKIKLYQDLNRQLKGSVRL